jgi:hypothetical protein
MSYTSLLLLHPLLQLPPHAAPLFPAGKHPVFVVVMGCLFMHMLLAVWLAAQTPHSKGAKGNVLQARYNLACAKHLPSAPVAEAYAAL